MLVSANGRYPKSGIESFKNLCREHNLALIEDSAQSLGSFYPGGKHMGSAGDIGSFSFSAPKIISTGQGGCLITNNDDLAFKLRRLKDFGRSSGGNDIHNCVGYNFKFTELQACVGIAQMEKLDFRTKRKKEIYQVYTDYLQDCSGIKLFEQDIINTTPWFIDSLVERRNELQNFLKKNGIGTRIMYPPINKQTAYNLPGDFPVCNIIGEKGLWLPSANQLGDEDVKYVCSIIKEFYRNE